jgi:hypothetical protein
MTPQEKAKELIEEFAELIPPIQYGNLLERDWDTAKQCALIAVDLIIEEANYWHNTSTYEESTEFEASVKRLEYWQQVKQRIIKL